MFQLTLDLSLGGKYSASIRTLHFSARFLRIHVFRSSLGPRSSWVALVILKVFRGPQAMSKLNAKSYNTYQEIKGLLLVCWRLKSPADCRCGRLGYLTYFSQLYSLRMQQA